MVFFKFPTNLHPLWVWINTLWKLTTSNELNKTPYLLRPSREDNQSLHFQKNKYILCWEGEDSSGIFSQRTFKKHKPVICSPKVRKTYDMFEPFISYLL